MPITQQTCFFVAILVFIVVGFRRGWRREVVSLVFVLLASFLIQPTTSDAVGGFLGRIPGIIAVMMGTADTTTPPTVEQPALIAGAFWSFVIFAAIVVLGYYVGNRVFPAPANPQERLIGIIPAIIAGAFIISSLLRFFEDPNGNGLRLEFTEASPTDFVPIIFVIAILALLGALIAARVKNAKK